jgi:hypothetical protein
MRLAGTLKDFENRPYVVQSPNDPPNPKRDDYVSDTRNHYVMLSIDDVPRPAVLALASTQLKKSRSLMSTLSILRWKRTDGTPFTPPTFAVTVRLTTVAESNEKGAWSGVRFEIAGPVADRELYSAARAFHDQVVSGAVTAAPHAPDVGEESGPEAF